MPWSDWTPGPDDYSVGMEEEVMLVDPASGVLVSAIDRVMGPLPEGMRAWVSAEQQQSVVEIKTSPHAHVTPAWQELVQRRRQLQAHLHQLDLVPASAGLHPFVEWRQVQVTGDDHHQEVYRSVGELARREPTFGLHVHVGVRDPEAGVHLLNRLRPYLPLFLAVSANSPFWQGRATGLAATRPSIMGAFPRTGLPHVFTSYADYVATVDALIMTETITEPGFIWWDVRLQPHYGTVEVRVMDAQLTARDAAALAALVQCVAKLELEGRSSEVRIPLQEITAENMFLAARDGAEAELISISETLKRRPARDLLAELVARCESYARELECTQLLEAGLVLAAQAGAQKQLDQAGRSEEDLSMLVQWLAQMYTNDST